MISQDTSLHSTCDQLAVKETILRGSEGEGGKKGGKEGRREGGREGGREGRKEGGKEGRVRDGERHKIQGRW